MMGNTSGSRRMPVDTESQKQKLKDDLNEIRRRIKNYEMNVKYLETMKTLSEESIINNQAALEKFDNTKLSTTESEEETVRHILSHPNSAAAILYTMKNQAKNLPPEHSLSRDMLGIVATLGRVNDTNLSRLLAEFLGLEEMLGVVFNTNDGVRALELYKRDGSIDESLGLHGFAASARRATLDSPFLAISLEDLRPYDGDFIPDDPQKRLALPKPRLPNGETPNGFLDFAVNMIIIDKDHLYHVTKNGHGLRETLFYNLFSNTQVYRSWNDMMKALPYIRGGAVSLDGGISKKNGVLYLGQNKGDIGVKFPTGFESLLYCEVCFELMKEVNKTRLKKDRISGDIVREKVLLTRARSNYKTKKQEFLQFLSESSSSHAPQFPVGRGQTPG